MAIVGKSCINKQDCNRDYGEFQQKKSANLKKKIKNYSTFKKYDSNDTTLPTGCASEKYTFTTV